MSDDKREAIEKLCQFAPVEKKADAADKVLYQKARTLDELNESSDRCMKHVSERLDQIEEEIRTGSNDRKTD